MDREHLRPAIRVAVAAPFAQLVRIHERAAEYADEIELCGAISDATRVLEQTRRLQPEVLLLSEGFGVGDAELVAQLNAVAPATRLIILLGVDAGARGLADAVVDGDAVAVELRGVIVGVARRRDAVDNAPEVAHATGEAATPPEAPASAAASGEAAGGRRERRAQTVLVFSGKGGVGKSIVAANLATALVASGSRVALVDLDLQYGDAGMLLHLESQATTIDALAALAAGGGLDAQRLDAGLATTPDGLRVLLAPRSPECADLVSTDGLEAILTELARTHDFLVVDSPAHLEQRIVAVIEVADHVLLVTGSSITAVKDTKMTLRLLQSLGIDPARVAVVLNQTKRRVGFAAEDIERALRYPLLAALPYEPRMDESIDSGRPLVLSEPRSGFSRQLSVVVAHVARRPAAMAAATAADQSAGWRLRHKRH